MVGRAVPRIIAFNARRDQRLTRQETAVGSTTSAGVSTCAGPLETALPSSSSSNLLPDVDMGRGGRMRVDN